MEKLFRKHFWIFHLAFLTLAAFLIAGAITAIVGQWVKGEPKVEAVANSAPTADIRTRNFNIANEANIFGALREDLNVPEDACTTDADCPRGKCEDGQCVADEDGPIPELADAVRSELRAKLVGTAVFNDPTLSVASIVDENEKGAAAGLYTIQECRDDRPPPPEDEDEDEDEDKEDEGPPINLALQTPCNDLMGVATIKVIEPERVYFYNREESRWEYLTLGEEPEGKGPRVKRKSKKSDKVALGDGIREKSEGSYEVDQAEVDKALGNLSSLATQARIVPAFEGGKPVGFKLFSIRPNSLYSKIGIQNGDVIKRINGYEMNSPDKALEVYQKLKDSKNVTVDLKRRGKAKTLEYAITP